MIERVGKCFGLHVCNWPRRVEVWCCFGEVKPHQHPGQHVEIVPLFGWGKFVRYNPNTNWQREEVKTITPQSWFKSFSIPAGWTHWFAMKRRPLIFLNITTGPSAARNLKWT